MTSYADHMTIAQIIHDFATTRGNLTDRQARDDLAAILERRMAAEKADALREAAMAYGPAQISGFFPARDGYTRAWLRNRAETIRTTETEGTR